MRKILFVSLAILALTGCKLGSQDSPIAKGTHTKPRPLPPRELQPVLGPCQIYVGNPGALEACKRGVRERKKGEQMLLESEAYERGRYQDIKKY